MSVVTSTAVNIVAHLDRFQLEHLAGNLRSYLRSNPDSELFTLLVQGGNDINDAETGYLGLFEVGLEGAIWEHGEDRDKA